MERVFWVGPRPPPPQLGELLAQHDSRLSAYLNGDAAIAGLRGDELAVAIVTAGEPDAPKWVEKLTQARPDVQVLLASDSGISRQVVLSLWAGASGVLEFKSQTRNEIVLEIQEWVSRHRQVRRERDLILRLHALNEEFLKTIISAEKRNIDLEEELEATKRPELPTDGPAQILIVDDDPAVLDVLGRIFAKHQCTLVKDGEAAIKELWERAFHVVVTDKNLPGQGGFEVMRQVKELSPETDVVMITGYSSKEAAIEAIEHGASAYIEKPFDDIKTVRDRIDGVIAIQRRRSKGQRYLSLIKDRNKDFLERYRALRSDLEAWMAAHSSK